MKNNQKNIGMPSLFIRMCALILACIILSCALFSCESESQPVYKGMPDGDGGTKITTSANVDDGNSSGKKRVALTFDDGPHNIRTVQIVDELEKYGFNATFFVVGNRVDGSDYNGSAALKYAVSFGNEIGIHGYTHEYYYDECSDSVYKSEIENTHNAIVRAVPDYKVKLMRPVGGKITDKRVQASAYSVIMWSVDSQDWRYKSRDTDEQAEQNINIIVENVMSSVSDGDIILMHDIYENTYEATKIILKRLYEEGYEVVTVSELIGSSISAGKQYSKRA